MTENKENTGIKETNSSMVCEGLVTYQTSLFDLDIFFGKRKTGKNTLGMNTVSGLSPIVKWPGGKEKELKYIIPNIPRFERFFEPFVGGGSVFMSMMAKEYYINDFSQELIDLYKNIASLNEKFFKYAEAIDRSWKNAATFWESNHELAEVYLGYKHEQIGASELQAFVHSFCENKNDEILEIIDTEFQHFPCILRKEFETVLLRKMLRMRELEISKHELPERDIYANIESAIKGAIYTNYRSLYNDFSIQKQYPELHCALFLFMRNYAYTGMFRYSSKGEFNVPYGGIAYNSKSMMKKLNYYRSKPVQEHFADTKIFNLDFEKFLRTVQPTEKDFVFFDPPYDTEFSTYAQNLFTQFDQERLANYVIDECKAKWMMIIKNTNFIYKLYNNQKNINIRTFDKEYLASFMNRNDKKVTHLLITNY